MCGAVLSNPLPCVRHRREADPDGRRGEGPVGSAPGGLDWGHERHR
ncbi:hypothetical protein HMPREF1550_01468 [Actinomyces sp. oral taxon 877 str. F0543]|nr:hypothetical protein HMPREF1550_01468 [Actinomyces sp. oral taxon 877 str. F0543]